MTKAVVEWLTVLYVTTGYVTEGFSNNLMYVGNEHLKATSMPRAFGRARSPTGTLRWHSSTAILSLGRLR